MTPPKATGRPETSSSSVRKGVYSGARRASSPAAQGRGQRVAMQTTAAVHRAGAGDEVNDLHRLAKRGLRERTEVNGIEVMLAFRSMPRPPRSATIKSLWDLLPSRRPLAPAPLREFCLTSAPSYALISSVAALATDSTAIAATAAP